MELGYRSDGYSQSDDRVHGHEIAHEDSGHVNNHGLAADFPSFATGAPKKPLNSTGNIKIK